MKIAFIGQKGIPALSGGVEKQVEGLAVALAHNGHQVFAYTRNHYTKSNLKEYQGIKIISLPSIPKKNLDAITHTFLAILDLLRRQVDVVHFHGIGPASLVWLAKLLKPGVKIVTTFHSQDYYNQKWGLFARLYLKFGEWMACTQSDEVVVISKLLAQYVRQSYNIEPIYIPNAVEVTPTSNSESLQQWGLIKGEYILAVARLIPLKGLHHLIKAYAEIESDKKLVIVGDGSYTDHYVTELKALAEKDPRVILTGQQSGESLVELFSNAFLFIQSSESEGLSVALLEAMAYGLPILVSDIPGNLEALGNTGFSFHCNNVDSLKNKLTVLLQQPEILIEKGKLAQARVAKEYNWKVITSAMESVYYEQMSRKTEKKIKRYSALTRFSTFV